MIENMEMSGSIDNREDIDGDPNHVYVVNAYLEQAHVAQYVVSSWEKVEEFIDAMLEDDPEIEACSAMPLVIDKFTDALSLH